MNELQQIEERVQAPDAVALVEQQRAKDLAEIAENAEFQKASKTTHAKEVANILLRKDLEIQDEELNRQWDEYLLEKKKEELDYRVKQEKGLTKQTVKADIKQKKREIAQKRYAHLYKKDANGELIDFTVSGFINRYKEFTNWYKSLTDNTQRLINSTFKFIFKAGLTVGVAFAVYKALQILAKSGIVILGG